MWVYRLQMVVDSVHYYAILDVAYENLPNYIGELITKSGKCREHLHLNTSKINNIGLGSS
jgi:hypothetical protein